MTQIFRIVFVAALCLVNCRSASVTQQGSVFASRASLPLLLSLLPATFSQDAQAADGEDSPETIMKELDKNNDGKLSLAEVFPQDDEDISAEEKEMVTKAFNVADGDK